VVEEIQRAFLSSPEPAELPVDRAACGDSDLEGACSPSPARSWAHRLALPHAPPRRMGA
jgi:hypothetical protein